MVKNNATLFVLIMLTASILYYKFIYTKYTPKIPISKTTLIQENGEKFDIHNLKNQVAVVSFFQSWCGDCRREIPELESLQKNVGGVAYLKIILISDESWDIISGVKKQSESNLNFYQSVEKLKEIGIKRFPTTYLLDKKGDVVKAKVEGIHWNNEENIKLIKKLNQ